ncbi:response regulator [uncultured Desulfobacter sp.]|uniref:response regulator n=1 Tax=uncultured Desulfobacter sp. TaxID=240139 RepID=UPI0029F5ADDE|nr:response regulator [uncultured Desulfobacter sp.]
MNRMLIVDDEEIGRTVMEEIFSKYGPSVSVSSGTDALQVYQKGIEKGKPFDLVLLDISLKDISGMEVLKKIKTIDAGLKEHKSMVIMVTSHGEKDIVIGCIKSGCKAYFIKPLKQDAVDKKMAELGFSPAQ